MTHPKRTRRVPSRPEKRHAGNCECPITGRKFSRIQILTVADVLNGHRVELPARPAAFAQAERERAQEGEQGTLTVHERSAADPETATDRNRPA